MKRRCPMSEEKYYDNFIVNYFSISCELSKFIGEESVLNLDSKINFLELEIHKTHPCFNELAYWNWEVLKFRHRRRCELLYWTTKVNVYEINGLELKYMDQTDIEDTYKLLFEYSYLWDDSQILLKQKVLDTLTEKSEDMTSLKYPDCYIYP